MYYVLCTMDYGLRLWILYRTVPIIFRLDRIGFVKLMVYVYNVYKYIVKDSKFSRRNWQKQNETAGPALVNPSDDTTNL